MLYLEDYLEMIEHLPQELRDRFTEVRELDLAVQNNMDSLDKKSRIFFQQCKRGELQADSLDSEFHNLRREYFKVMEDADEKVAIATQIHELVERYLRRLDKELFKFKCELEADNNGITEILEKRSLELDGNNSTAATALLLSMNQKENRYYGSCVGNNLMGSSINSAAGIITSTGSIGTGSSGSAGINALSTLPTTQLPVGHTRHRKLEKRRETICTVPVPEKRPNLNHSLPTVSNANTSGNTIANATGNHVNSINTHVIYPIAGSNSGNSNTGTVAVSSNVVRQLPTNITAHSVLSNNAAAAAAAAVVAASGAGNTAANSSVSYNLQQLGGGAAASSAIVAAASQAIVATQQMQQGRRTASLKASYEAIHGAGVAGSSEFWTAAQTSMQTTATSLGNAGHHQQQEKKQKKKLNSSISMPTGIAVQSLGGSSSGNSITSSSSSMSADSVDMLSNASSTTISNLSHNSLSLNTIGTNVTPSHAAAAAAAVTVPNVGNVTATAITLPTTPLAPGANLTISENGLVVEQGNEGEWSYDPNEPRYCTCNQVSYGDMVACDNDACPYEWFHYPCVGITQPPKGKWYCPKCTASMRRRGNRKN